MALGAAGSSGRLADAVDEGDGGPGLSCQGGDSDQPEEHRGSRLATTTQSLRRRGDDHVARDLVGPQVRLGRGGRSASNGEGWLPVIASGTRMACPPAAWLQRREYRRAG
jgi:hypothetical protein